MYTLYLVIVKKNLERGKEMSRKLFNYIVALVGVVGSGAIATVTYFEPTGAAAINGAIGIAVTAITEILSKFVKDGAEKK